MAIHESGWGSSKIAKDKKNLFGFGAYDRSPYDSAVTFATYEEGIETVAKYLVKNYINEKNAKSTFSFNDCCFHCWMFF